MGRRRLQHQPSQLRTPEYRFCHIVCVTGPHHAPTFTAETSFHGQVRTHYSYTYSLPDRTELLKLANAWAVDEIPNTSSYYHADIHGLLPAVPGCSLQAMARCLKI